MTTQRTVLKNTRVGHVTSDKRNKTRTVTFGWLQKVPKYGKYVRRQTVFHVHDDANTSHLGDLVEIAPCRPISKTKSWRLVRVLQRAPAGTGEPMPFQEAKT